MNLNGAVDKLSPEQKMIAECKSNSADFKFVTNDDFSKWVNSEILGCGMGKDWQNSWE